MRSSDKRAAGQLIEIVSAALAERGFQPKAEPPANANHADLQGAYDTIEYHRTSDQQHPPLNNSYALGPVVATIARKNSADAVVMVIFEGVTRSHGSVVAETALNTLIAIGTGFVPAKDPNGAALIDFAFIDGKSGEVLWEDREAEVWGVTVPTFDQSELSSLVTKSFAKFQVS